jgi:hypothetical protein
VTLGDDRVFARTESYFYYGLAESDAIGGNGYDQSVELLALGGMRDGELRLAVKELDANNSGYAVGAAGKRLVMTGYNPPSISVLDATDLDALSYEREADLDGYVQSVSLSGDLALCSLGPWGLVSVDVGD